MKKKLASFFFISIFENLLTNLKQQL